MLLSYLFCKAATEKRRRPLSRKLPKSSARTHRARAKQPSLQQQLPAAQVQTVLGKAGIDPLELARDLHDAGPQRGTGAQIGSTGFTSGGK